MKSILYAGLALMTFAVIYGFVDYSKQKTKMENLYESVIPAEKNPVADDKASVKENAAPENPVTEEKKIMPVENTKKKEPVRIKRKKEKKVNLKMYSRAALDEEMLKAEKKSIDPKKENARMEQKEN